MPSKYPSIPDFYAGQSASLEVTVRAMREAVEILCGHRGSDKDRAVRYGEFTGNDSTSAANPYLTIVQQAEAATETTTVDWGDIVNVPTEFPPAAHTHPTSEVTGLATVLAGYALLAGALFTGTVQAPLLNIPTGLGPGSPNIGDLWSTVDGLFYRDGASRTRQLDKWSVVSSQALSGLTTCDFTDLDRYSEVVLRLDQVSCSGAGATLQLLCATDNVTFATAGYTNLEHGQTDAGVPAGYTTGVAATAYIGPNTTLLSSAAGTVSGMYHLFGMGVDDLFGNFELANHGATRGHFNGFCKAPAGVQKALRLQWSAGTFDAGTAVLLGR